VVYQPSEDLVPPAAVVGIDDQPVIEGLTLRRIAWRRLKQDRVAMAAGVTLILLVLVGVFASQLDHLLGHNPRQLNTGLTSVETTLPLGPFGGVSTQHWLGIEPVGGQDILVQLIAGCRTSMMISGASMLMTLLFGVTFGVIAGYYGGVVDALLTLLFDMLLTIPWLLLALALAELLSQAPEFLGLSGENLSVSLMIFLIGFGGFPYLARLVRGQVLSLRRQEFVEAARSLGANDLRIITRELMPNLMGPLLVCTSLMVPTYIMAESALSYLGIGVRPPTVSWGGMLSEAQPFYTADPMCLFLPGAALFVTVLAFNLFGDGLRDAFDPKSTQ
jgi:ABC-type dipeptide/oligopeptide/nickel transport system permease subunit